MVMETIRIVGRTRLNGRVLIQGAKGSAQNILPATVLLPSKYIIHNWPDILDVAHLLTILEFLGARVQKISNKTISIDTTSVVLNHLPLELTNKSNSSFLFAGALLSRFGSVTIGHPKGDELGDRPVNWHLSVFEQLGASISEKFQSYQISLGKPTRGVINLPHFTTVGGTVNAIFASIHKATTIRICNAAMEPEVDDLINFLKRTGVHIYRESKNIIVKGKPKHPPNEVEFEIVPDRVDAATFAIAAVLCKGKVTLENVVPEHMRHILEIIESVGGDTAIASNNDGRVCLEISCNETKRASLEIETGRYPAFASDYGPLVHVLMTQIEGHHFYHETIFAKRFFHIFELVKMGANVSFFESPKYRPKYVFDLPQNSQDCHSICVVGCTQLIGCQVIAHDIRAGASLVLAGLSAHGTTEILKPMHIDRGYFNLCGRLQNLGATVSIGYIR